MDEGNYLTDVEKSTPSAYPSSTKGPHACLAVTKLLDKARVRDDDYVFE
jgi:hypothetical protein